LKMELNKKQFATEVAGRQLIFETSRLAEQATAAVIGRYGETAVLVTVVINKENSPVDYLPLTVDYEEKFYAAGKIIGSRFIRRESRPSDEAILSGRLVDRTIRPLFDHRLRREIQLVITILSIDGENDPDFVALMTASVALAVSEIPWQGPVAGVRIAKINNQYLINPTIAQLNQGFDFEAFAAGPQDKINMIELEGREAQESDLLKALEISQKEINQLIKFQEAVVKEIGKAKLVLTVVEPDRELTKKVKVFLDSKLERALFDKSKQERKNDLAVVKEELVKYLSESGYSDKDGVQADQLFEQALDEVVHQNALEKNRRPDGRQFDEVRELHSQVGLFKRNHGSALFIRGSTQALAITTLAPPEQEQLIESMEFSGKKRFLLHYNFPPYSTGETGRLRGPGRREIGHGALAEKAVKNLIPTKDEFPYTIRVVSEILSSNGSSSMATVCAASLSLMDAGVPLKKSVAGIAMGLMTNKKGDYKILTDIQGPEDYYGDMDFKAAGTKDGVTAVQLDVKIAGLTPAIIKETLDQAKKARLQIIDSLEKTLVSPRKEISSYAPVVLVQKIDKSKIGMVIGSGGKTINAIIAQTGATGIDIDEDGKVYIYASQQAAAEAARQKVEAIAHEYKIGELVEGKVVKLLDFGAIVEFGFNQDGMVHISEIKDDYVKNIKDVLNEGDFVRAKIIKIENGRIGLSMKGLR